MKGSWDQKARNRKPSSSAHPHGQASVNGGCLLRAVESGQLNKGTLAESCLQFFVAEYPSPKKVNLLNYRISYISPKKLKVTYSATKNSSTLYVQPPSCRRGASSERRKRSQPRVQTRASGRDRAFCSNPKPYSTHRSLSSSFLWLIR